MPPRKTKEGLPAFISPFMYLFERIKTTAFPCIIPLKLEDFSSSVRCRPPPFPWPGRRTASPPPIPASPWPWCSPLADTPPPWDGSISHWLWLGPHPILLRFPLLFQPFLPIWTTKLLIKSTPGLDEREFMPTKIRKWKCRTESSSRWPRMRPLRTLSRNGPHRWRWQSRPAAPPAASSTWLPRSRGRGPSRASSPSCPVRSTPPNRRESSPRNVKFSAWRKSHLKK